MLGIAQAFLQFLAIHMYMHLYDIYMYLYICLNLCRSLSTFVDLYIHVRHVHMIAHHLKVLVAFVFFPTHLLRNDIDSCYVDWSPWSWSFYPIEAHHNR